MRMNTILMENTPLIESGLDSVQELLTGTLTFMFTDIESSTTLWEQHPEQMCEAMARHDALIESVVIQQKGWLVRPRGEGDSRFAVFPRASNALLAAITIQRLVLAEPWAIPSPRLRIALHSGEASFRDGDYYGNAVNRCARLRSAAHGGQILVSETTHCLVQDEWIAGVSLHDLGEYHLKGLERPEHIFQPVVADLPSEFPPPNTLDRIRNNLPLALTSFIGREGNIDELVHLLSLARLLTVTGSGGTGKTRLAIRVAQNVQGSFPDGIWFIDLETLTSTSLLSQHIMSVLGVREEPGYCPNQTLLDSLHNQAVLLILDNCEHLLPGVAQLAESILRSAPRVRILATSREKLGASGEAVWRIPPLSSPAPGTAITIENLMQYEAAKLFQERAAAARTDFLITPENAAAVAQICTRLDGMPLAIELAAARVRVLSIEEIVSRLDDRFRLLVGSRTALPRQQTLQALIDWSYDLLTDKEQALFHRLSVFAASWTLEAAEQVCADGVIQAWEVLDLLTGLIDKSFVIGETRDNHERYRFLETIHKFSQQRLEERGETGKYGQKHAEYFLKVVASAYGKMWGSEQVHWLMRLDEEYKNLRAALGWLLKSPGCEEMFLQLAGSLWRYWEIRGHLNEGRSWLEMALAKNTNADDYMRANGLGGAGHLARQQADLEQAKTLHEQSLNLFRKLGNNLSVARQLNALGEIAQFQGDYSRAIELHEESLTIMRDIGDNEGIAVSLRLLGVIARDRGQYQPAREFLEESLRLERALGDKLLMAHSLNDLGLLTHHLCEYERASSLFEEAISIQRELNDRPGISNSIQNLGNVMKDQGNFKQADVLYKECLMIKQELGDKRGISRTIASLAEVAFLQGKYPQAADLARQSLYLSEQLGIKRVILYSSVVLGFIAFYQGNFEIAATYADKSLNLSEEISAPQAVGYAKVLLALGKYAKVSLVEARDQFQEALTIFQTISDSRNIAITYVNLARTAYRQGDNSAAMLYLDESLSISQALNIRWTLGFVREIMGLLQRRMGNYKRALELFQESLLLAIEQENQQGIANCLGALAGLAAITNRTRQAARLFAAATKLRKEMGASMSNSDRQEYENYLSMVHEHLDHTTFEAEWTEGLTMTTKKIIEDLSAW